MEVTGVTTLRWYRSRLWNRSKPSSLITTGWYCKPLSQGVRISSYNSDDVCVGIYKYTYIHTNIHTYIHTYKREKKLKTTALQKDNWPINKKELIRKYYKEFVKLINDIPYDKSEQQRIANVNRLCIACSITAVMEQAITPY